MFVGNSLFNDLFATGFAVLCLYVCGNSLFNKFRAAIMRRKKRSSDDNENEDVLQGNDTNNDTENDTDLSENENVFSHYETINESGMIEMFHPSSQNLSNLPWASNIVQSSQTDNTCLEVNEADSTYLEVIEDTNNQKLDPRTKLNKNEDHVSMNSSSPKEERNMSTFIFLSKNGEVDKGNTINKESQVAIETNYFEDCKTSNDSTSVSSSSSEQSAGERIQERDKKKKCDHPGQYMSLNMNDMEYLNSYSSLITENKQRESKSKNSNNSESPGTNIL